MSVQTWKTHWANIDQSGDPQHYVGQMAALRKQHEELVDISYILTFCYLQVGERVLDVGCGTGWHVRVASRIVGPTGRAVGVDLSEAMVAEARQIAAARGADVDFVHGSAYSLPFEQNSFDRCWILEVTHILDDPVQALREMVRVTRPGGHICLVEYESDAAYIIPAGDPITRRVLDFIREHELAHPSGFEMVSILKSLGTIIEQLESGLNNMDLIPDFAAVRALYLDEWLADAVTAGVLTPEEARQWLVDQEAHAAEGSYILGLPYFLINATKQ
jgi:ubiquinone/menaquinone biosynthesis C-methylase UbiE